MPRNGRKSRAKAASTKKGQAASSRANLIPFQKGQSGNPAGRPPGSKSFKTVIAALMDQVFDFELYDLGDRDAQLKELLAGRAAELGGSLTWREAAILIQGYKAIVNADTYALSLMADREEGRAKQMVEIKDKTYADFLGDLPEPDDA